MAEPREVLQRINRAWSAQWFLVNLNQARLKLTGPVLKVDLGNLLGSLGINSRLEPDGFVIGTNVDYGVYWEGTEEGRVASGEAGFGGIGTRPARSFIRSTLMENETPMESDLELRYRIGIPSAFPNQRIDFNVSFGR